MTDTRKRQLGTPAGYGPRQWVQVERRALEQWASLSTRNPRASALMHVIVARMSHQNALVCSQKLLAKLMGVSTDTVQRALKILVEEKWLQVVKLNGPGNVCAYVVNSAVAWGESRDQLPRLSVFHAAVVADADDQDAETLSHRDLRQIPIVIPPEEALPHGDGQPGAQIALPGMEPVVIGQRDVGDE